MPKGDLSHRTAHLLQPFNFAPYPICSISEIIESYGDRHATPRAIELDQLLPQFH